MLEMILFLTDFLVMTLGPQILHSRFHTYFQFMKEHHKKARVYTKMTVSTKICFNRVIIKATSSSCWLFHRTKMNTMQMSVWTEVAHAILE